MARAEIVKLKISIVQNEKYRIFEYVNKTMMIHVWSSRYCIFINVINGVEVINAGTLIVNPTNVLESAKN